jgi:hypothetical protein
MMKPIFALALFLPVAVGFGPQDKKGPKNKEVQKKYHDLMEAISKENKGIKKDIEEKKGDAAIKTRLMAIRKNAEDASKLDYLKGTEEEVESFKSMFDIFLEIRIKQFLDRTWDEKTSEDLYERLQAACRTCHELFRQE